MTTLLVLCTLLGTQGQVPDTDRFQATFSVNPKDFVTTGKGKFFILEPEYQLVLKGGSEELKMTVLEKTKVVDGVKTRVVEERHFEDGELVEVSLNYYAMDRKTKDVYYFGEDVDIYEGGKVVRHEGAWLSGVKGARYGLFMPNEPRIGFRHYQEIAPGSALDRAEVIGLSEVFKTPAGEFRDCLKVEESSGMSAAKETKLYAPGIGIIQDEALLLVWHGYIDDRPV